MFGDELIMLDGEQNGSVAALDEPREEIGEEVRLATQTAVECDSLIWMPGDGDVLQFGNECCTGHWSDFTKLHAHGLANGLLREHGA